VLTGRASGGCWIRTSQTFELDSSGNVVVGVHQVVRDLSGTVLFDRMVEHIYTLKDGLIQSMTIRE